MTEERKSVSNHSIVLPEFVVRMMEELDQLDKRIDRLEVFLSSGGDLSEEKWFLMRIQLNAMKIYRDALFKRLDICAKECR